ncbi:MAG: hypothetical protein ACXW3S_15290, partial [Rhodoplanes sp.]
CEPTAYKVLQVIACDRLNRPVLAPPDQSKEKGRNEKLDKQRLIQGDAKRLHDVHACLLLMGQARVALRFNPDKSIFGRVE